MFQLNPASIESDINSDSSNTKNTYKKPYNNNKTIKNKKVDFIEEDTPTKTKIQNVSNILSKIHSNTENEENIYSNNDFQEKMIHEQSKSLKNNISNTNIIANEINKMNSIDTNNINHSSYNNSSIKNSYSQLEDSYKSNYDFLGNNNIQGTLANNKELLNKLDYIVHLLEEQHNEKTNHITEELILYVFLGIFIIFVLDSFARASKYVR